MATRADFLVQCVVRVRQSLQGLKTSSKEIGRNVHLDEDFLPVSQKTPIRTSSEELERVVRRVREARSKRSNNISDGKISACSHGFTNLVIDAGV